MIWVTVAIWFLVDLGLALLLWLQYLNASLYFTGHLLTTFLAGWALFRYAYTGARKRRMRATVLFGFLLALFVPLIGLLASAFVVATVWVITWRQHLTVYDEYEEYIFSQTEKERFRDFEGVEQIQQEILLEPYINILERVGSDPRKPLLIDKLSREPTPESVALLRSALKDEAVEVQQFAAAALVRLEDVIQDEIQKGQEAIGQLGRASDYAHLGSLYQRYAGLGLLDTPLARYFLSLAAQAFQVSLEIDFNQPLVYHAYVAVLMELGRVEEAVRILDQAESREVRSTRLLMQRSEVDFRRRDFGRLMRRFQKIDLSECSPNEREVVEFWLAR
jgi:tetratricopeptide (TPR) repeat protein